MNDDDMFVVQDEETQVNGIVMMMDLDGVGWSHAKNISPLYAKRIMGLIQVRWLSNNLKNSIYDIIYKIRYTLANFLILRYSTKFDLQSGYHNQDYKKPSKS